MKRICFITPEPAAYGFALAGVEQRTTRPEEAEATLCQVLEEGKVGLLALDERLLPAISAESLLQAERNWPGVLVLLPAPSREEGGDDYVRRLVARAIGYQVRLT